MRYRLTARVEGDIRLPGSVTIERDGLRTEFISESGRLSRVSLQHLYALESHLSFSSAAAVSGIRWDAVD